ncbi:protein FAM83F-like [Arapaima gigas]
MAESQLLCMDDSPVVFQNISESKAAFFYSEPQRVALEKLLAEGDAAFKAAMEGEDVREFLSAGELAWIRDTFREYASCKEPKKKDKKEKKETKKQTGAESQADSGLRSTYWPQMSDIEVPALDLGWVEGMRYNGATRVEVYTHPPKSENRLIKEAARKLIQESRKVLAVVMDLLTDPQILMDLLDAVSKRRVSVYIVLDSQGVPHFLNMCRQLKISAVHLQTLRVRSLEGWGMSLTLGRIPGSLSNRYMFVDGEKVMFGTYSFTWSSSRLNRTMMTVMTGQVVDIYDQDFRELYAVSDEVNLYRELQIPKQSTTMAAKATLNRRPPSIYSTTRFQVALGDQANPRVPAHKYYNPKYALMLESMQPKEERSKNEDLISSGGGNLVMQKFLQAKPEEADEVDEITEMPDRSSEDEAPGKKKQRFLGFETFRRKYGKSQKVSMAHGSAAAAEGLVPEQPAPDHSNDSENRMKSKKSCTVS